MNGKRAGILAAVLSLLLCITGCRQAAEPVVRSDFALDTAVSVSVYAPVGQTAETALTDALDEMRRLEKLFSIGDADSEVCRLNKEGNLTVSTETAELLSLSLQIAAESEGAFDPTIRPLTALWDFVATPPLVPDDAALQAAVDRVGYERLSLVGNTATIKDGAIDLGGIAKGYIADRLRERLKASGVTSALIDLGGNIVACGSKNGGEWKIGVKNPTDLSALRATVVGRDFSVVTSGIYERGFTLNGVRYHHLLDPKTGMPVQNGLASVTIVTRSSAIADGLSTACFVQGEQQARELLSRYPDTEALFVYTDGTLSATDGLVCIDPKAATPAYRFS